MIAGSIEYNSKEQSSDLTLNPGSYVESEGKFSHDITNTGDSEATIYIRTNSKYQVK